LIPEIASSGVVELVADPVEFAVDVVHDASPSIDWRSAARPRETLMRAAVCEQRSLAAICP
jgi:hypothetical protein